MRAVVDGKRGIAFQWVVDWVILSMARPRRGGEVVVAGSEWWFEEKREAERCRRRRERVGWKGRGRWRGRAGWCLLGATAVRGSD